MVRWFTSVTVLCILEQDTRFELAPSAWKADMLAANTNPAKDRFPMATEPGEGLGSLSFVHFHLELTHGPHAPPILLILCIDGIGTVLKYRFRGWVRGWDSNPRPPAYETGELPTAQPHDISYKMSLDIY